MPSKGFVTFHCHDCGYRQAFRGETAVEAATAARRAGWYISFNRKAKKRDVSCPTCERPDGDGSRRRPKSDPPLQAA